MNKMKKKMAEMPSINFKKKDNDYENNVCKHQEGLEGYSCRLHDRYGNVWRGFEQKPWLCLRIRDSIPNATAFLRESKRSNYVYNNNKKKRVSSNTYTLFLLLYGINLIIN